MINRSITCVVMACNYFLFFISSGIFVWQYMKGRSRREFTCRPSCTIPNYLMNTKIKLIKQNSRWYVITSCMLMKHDSTNQSLTPIKELLVIQKKYIHRWRFSWFFTSASHKGLYLTACGRQKGPAGDRLGKMERIYTNKDCFTISARKLSVSIQFDPSQAEIGWKLQ